MKAVFFTVLTAVFAFSSLEASPKSPDNPFAPEKRTPKTPFLLGQSAESQAPTQIQTSQSAAPDTFSIERRRTPAPSPSEGRFNTTLALGFLTAYAYRENNKTLALASAAATYTAYGAWSRRRTRLRNNEDGPNQAYFRGETDEYEFRKGRGDTAAALALVSALGIATKRQTLAAVGGVGAVWGYSRYRETHRERNRAQERQRQNSDENTPETRELSSATATN